MKVGERYTTNSYGEVEIIEYIDSRNCLVKFNDGTTLMARPYNVLQGNVKNPNQPKEGRVGFVGTGVELAYENGKATYAYVKWKSMLHRCYYSSSLKDSYYNDCMVVNEWHNFQNFSVWIKTQRGFGLKGWHLDKDLLVKNNRTYAPQFCALLPHEVNLFLLFREKQRGEFPIGVTLHKGSNKFHAMISSNANQRTIGTYDTPESAFAAYKKAKEAEARRLAKKYEELVEPVVYESLINFTVDITD